MSQRTSEASKAITAAWKKEQALVLEGKGTRDWTPEEQASIIENGKAYDENGKAYEGHHMKSAEAYPEYQGDADNIQFLTRQEHQNAHEGWFQNPTNGYYDPETGKTQDFGEGKYVPCETVSLSDPVYGQENALGEDFDYTGGPVQEGMDGASQDQEFDYTGGGQTQSGSAGVSQEAGMER